MQTTYHPLTAKQKAELRGYVAWSTSVGRVVIFIIVALCLGGVLRSLVEHTKPGVHYLSWLVPTLVAMGLLFYISRRWTGGRHFREQVRADLRQGTMAAHRIDAVEAIEVEELEDEGPSFFVKTADGQVIVFTGQYLDRLKRRGFPWKSFEILEAPASKVFFGLKGLAGQLVPSFIREPFTLEEFNQFKCRNYRTIEVDFESLKTKPARPVSAAGRAQAPPR